MTSQACIYGLLVACLLFPSNCCQIPRHNSRAPSRPQGLTRAYKCLGCPERIRTAKGMPPSHGTTPRLAPKSSHSATDNPQDSCSLRSRGLTRLMFHLPSPRESLVLKGTAARPMYRYFHHLDGPLSS
ncbi:hypothetical protein GE09DRAFT_506077 [Coniochaeta sp. 2T2.1]|nr:hypothetical protein GE09DRAFT_506077 [Coniochaeta sp. 2T2.1]